MGCLHRESALLLILLGCSGQNASVAAAPAYAGTWQCRETVGSQPPAPLEQVIELSADGSSVTINAGGCTITGSASGSTVTFTPNQTCAQEGGTLTFVGGTATLNGNQLGLSYSLSGSSGTLPVDGTCTKEATGNNGCAPCLVTYTCTIGGVTGPTASYQVTPLPDGTCRFGSGPAAEELLCGGGVISGDASVGTWSLANGLVQIAAGTPGLSCRSE